MLYLAGASGVSKASDIAEAMCVPPKYLPNIAQKLKEHGLLSAVQGAKGGYVLARPASEICLLDVLEAMDDAPIFNRCLNDPAYCNRMAVPYCAVHALYKTCQEHVSQVFAENTLDVLVKNMERNLEAARELESTRDEAEREAQGE